jgi:methionyl-tRNA formyltransferase
MAKPQDNTLVTKAPKLFKETCEIDFNQSTEKVHNFIRGLSPFPSAWTTLDGQQLKLLRATKEIAAHNIEPGKYISDNKNYLKFSTTDGFVSIHELQLQGKRRMEIKDFLNGYKF